MTERPGTVDGRRIGSRYRMGAPLAAGGMGEVWVARDLLLDRPVAVKVLGGALAGDGRAAERLRREARAVARLDHPNIARVLDLGEHDGRPYLVMELLEGESLAGRIDRAGPMAPGEAARVVAAVADALQAAHRAGVVHRDVKPGNVFLTAEGEVKVLDFGIASAAGEADLTTGDLLGTAAYLAPERALGRPATPAADIYSLGVVLYELLAGRRPFEGGSHIELAMAHVNAHPEPLGPGRPVGTAVPGRRLRAGHGQGPGRPPPVRGRLGPAPALPGRRRARDPPGPRRRRPPGDPPASPPGGDVHGPAGPVLAGPAPAPLAAARSAGRPAGLRRGAGPVGRGAAPGAVRRPGPDTTAPADEPATRPADQPGPPAPADQSLADDQPDRRADDRDDDSSGPGSGGDGSGGGGSGGPG
jgi:eukaryotic-like serine/threonine-protein kinase